MISNSYKAFKGTVENGALPSLLEGWLGWNLIIFYLEKNVFEEISACSSSIRNNYKYTSDDLSAGSRLIHGHSSCASSALNLIGTFCCRYHRGQAGDSLWSLERIDLSQKLIPDDHPIGDDRWDLYH